MSCLVRDKIWCESQAVICKMRPLVVTNRTRCFWFLGQVLEADPIKVPVGFENNIRRWHSVARGVVRQDTGITNGSDN